MRIALGGLSHETNTYADAVTGPTGLDRFVVRRGDHLLTARGTATFVGGFIEACEAIGAQPVPTLWAWANPSGTITADAYATLRDELLDRLAAALPVDAVALELHGAGVVEGIDDLEGDLGAAVRALVGPDVPIVAALDLHGNVTDRMAEVFDVFFGNHLYPHTDGRERGYEAVAAVPPILVGRWEPVIHVEHLPMLLPPATTDPGEPAAEMNALCRAIEARPGVIDCTVFHGFPFVDVPHVGVHVVVTTDADRPLAAACAGEVAAWIRAHRDRFRREAFSPEGAVRAATKLVAEGTRPVVVNETCDNPGGGAPGDGTHLLRAMLDADLQDAAFGFVADPEVAARAHRAGVGARLDVRLGGKHGDLHGPPLAVSGVVRTLTDGRIVLQHMLKGVRIDLGPSARLRVGGVDVVVTSNPFQTMDAEVFLLHGIDVTRCSVVGLKSSQHFRAGFRDLAGAILTADAPGLTTNQVEVFDHPRAGRPLWPIDPIEP
ncbi:MAG TPA: M81 family metallopeptidase [Acidimicrobiales bacterium]